MSIEEIPGLGFLHDLKYNLKSPDTPPEIQLSDDEAFNPPTPEDHHSDNSFASTVSSKEEIQNTKYHEYFDKAVTYQINPFELLMKENITNPVLEPVINITSSLSNGNTPIQLIQKTVFRFFSASDQGRI